MALQTFTPGQVLTAAQVTALQSNDFNQTVSTKTASYTLVALDKGTRVVMNSASATTITVNTSLFNAGDTLQIHNIGAGVCTITAGTATVSTAGSLALPTNAGGTLFFTSTGVAIFFPTVAGSSASGLELINTTSFSGVASTSVNNVFNATYENYRIVIETTASSGNFLNLKLRAAGTDNSTANYTWGMVNVTNGAAAFQLAGSALTTGWSILRPSTTRSACSFDVYSPALAQQTMFTGTQSYNDGATIAAAGAIGGFHSVSSAFDGFTLSHAGNITGKVCIYGYNL